MRKTKEHTPGNQLRHIFEIASKLGLTEDDLELYGRYKAKIRLEVARRFSRRKSSSLILVSAMTPTPAGEGKTTVSIGLAQALAKIGKSTVAALREPSLGPVFGIKGGATGGGLSRVHPVDDINLHFTNDFPAVESAHNLLSAILDNSIFHGNPLNIDPRKITWRRVIDMNDRSLRDIVIGLGGSTNGVPRETGFDIVPSSEIMAILCLSRSYEELKDKISRILVSFTYDDKPVIAGDLKVEGAVSALLKYALMPNLVQTTEGVPAIVHGGPFANIAQGTNSIIGTELALCLADYVVTEAGFGFDLGAEKYFDIVAPYGNFNPRIVVLVATIRALKYHAGIAREELNHPNAHAAVLGMANLRKHYENIDKFNVPCIVALNRFPSDTDEEIQAVVKAAENEGMNIAPADIFKRGGEGGLELAEKTVRLIAGAEGTFTPLYDWKLPVEDKIFKVASEIYGAVSIDYQPQARRNLDMIKKIGYDKLPVCIAKTQQSLSDNPNLLGLPSNFIVTVREIKIASGAGFLIPITGEILRMPGLSKTPAAYNINIDETGNIQGIV
ncbi:MAG TPA: formate--tetrahydrofolate ligase [Smithellaceae bacterium]|nr:formate--tetrahydrofolate ligase [Smithellaceae bacterium]HOQ40920.1 formate--tetrahydrofolate ligase [Smithellaceae bacterium]HQP24164.1 formate--tetrahydrofolate ligase [Smithellaceae bacterium]HRY35420.1 formate--tetrahydrofolate ligase [Smithellaceae bacterium]